MKNGGPAFPVLMQGDEGAQVGASTGRHEGLSLLDYFAAHAPAEPALWFEPAMPTTRPEGVKPLDRAGFPANMEAIDAWDDERNVQRLKQWPYAWAAAMLEARKKYQE